MSLDLAHLEELSLAAEDRRRIAITLSCPDADDIPKVPQAGEVLDEGGQRVQVMHNGVRVVEDGYYGRWMTELIRLLRGHHEPQEEKVFHELLKRVPPGSTMLELGSHWSYYSLWFQQQVPDAHTFMIEPDPHNLAVGKKNFGINGRTGEFFQASVGSTSLPSASFLCESDLTARELPCIAVDDFLQEQGIEKLELLLADVQGAELAMLKGAARSMAQGRLRFVVISTHHHSISHDPILHQRCLNFLREHNAHILAEHSVSESYSGDGLIAASFHPRDASLPNIEISRNRASHSLFPEAECYLAEATEKIAALEAELASANQRYDLQRCQVSDLRTTIDALRTEIRNASSSDESARDVQRLSAALAEKNAVLETVLGSKSWRATEFLRRISRALRRRSNADR